jgi:uncharacterized membrane protein YhaH (DUF805 family)
MLFPPSGDFPSTIIIPWMNYAMMNADNFSRSIAQRRSLIEIAIAIGFICLLAGFFAGAAWQWKRFHDVHPLVIEVPEP